LAAQSSGPVVDLILGVDFGTSCSKVVIGDPNWRGETYAVPIGDERKGLARFLRTTRINAGGTIESNLKLRLMEDPMSAWNRDLATLYLAGVIRDSIRWFLNDGPRNYVARTLVWSLNLGFPAKQLNDTHLAAAYQTVAKEAAFLAASDLPLVIESLAVVRRSSSGQSSIPEGRVSLYPEIAAQLAGYVNSPFRQEGSMILIDVGAGTLDVSTIILHGGTNESIVSFHFCEVGPFGVLKLLEKRLAALGANDSAWVGRKLAEFQQGTTAVPDDPQRLLGNGTGITPAMWRAFSDASIRFGDEAINLAIGCASRFRRRQRDANDNPAFEPWGSQLRFFFTGGGSRSAFFQDLFVHGPFEKELTRFTRWATDPGMRRNREQGLLLEPLPLPPELKNFPPHLAADFDRLSVAHGLSFGKADLMRITASAGS
jgi:hypothetical protein